MAHEIIGDKNRYKNDSLRTFYLTYAYANKMSAVEKMDAYKELTNDEKTNLASALSYLQNHVDMIEYKFDDQNKLRKIILGPIWWTMFPKSRDRSCRHMRILFKFFKKIFEFHNIDVELSKRCTSAAPAAGPNVETNVETVGTNVGTDVETNVETNVGTNGGYKSRRRNRKPARKTRRRGRGRDRRGKSHHKKYTH